MTKMTKVKRAKELPGRTVTAIHDVGKWDIVIEFDDGRLLRVYDANWTIREGDDE